MSIKVKVNIPFDINRCLENDMKSFGFIKKDSNINKNKFVNQLLKNYYLTFSTIENKIVKNIESYIHNKNIVSFDENILHNIVSLARQNSYEEKYYYDYSIQFIINKENEKIFSTIEKYYLRDRTISEYFREMFISYASNKQDKRELLLFPDIVLKLHSAIENKKRVIIVFENNSTLLIDPFAIDQTKEELYNYLIGVAIYKDNRREILSTKIFKIKDAIITDEDSNISDIEKELLVKTMEHGAQFPINEKVITAIEFTSKGEKLYENAYLHRPKYFKKENNIYYFDCSITQIDFYFFKFGETIKILSPEKLKNRFSKRYYESLNNYKRPKTHS